MKKVYIKALLSFLCILCLHNPDVLSCRYKKPIVEALQKQMSVCKKPNQHLYNKPKIWHVYKKLGEGGLGYVYKIYNNRALKIIKDSDNVSLEYLNLQCTQNLGLTGNKLEYVCIPLSLRHNKNLCQAEFDLAISDAWKAAEKICKKICKQQFDGDVFQAFVETLIVHAFKGLNELHKQNVYHGDMKLANVLLFLENGNLKFKLNDLSIFHPFIAVTNSEKDCDNKMSEYVRRLFTRLENNARNCYSGEYMTYNVNLRNKIIEQSNKLRKTNTIDTDCNGEVDDFLRKFDIWTFCCNCFDFLDMHLVYPRFVYAWDALEDISRCDTVEQVFSLSSFQEMEGRVEDYKHRYDWSKILEVKEDTPTKIINHWSK